MTQPNQAGSNDEPVGQGIKAQLDYIGLRLDRFEGKFDKVNVQLTKVEHDVGILNRTVATKADVAECKTAIAEAKASILTWVVGSVFWRN